MQSHIFRFLITPILLAAVVLAQQPQNPAAPQRLNLVVIEGDGAINNIKLRTSRETIVQVEDENHKPVAGAVVAFLLPDSGPGGTFVNAAKSATVVTDSSGRAVMPRMVLNSNPGKFEIRVHASHEGLEASVVIAQTTVAVAAGLSTGVIVAIIVGVAAAGAAGAVLATRGGSSSQGPSTIPGGVTTPTGTIGTGSGTFGPPH